MPLHAKKMEKLSDKKGNPTTHMVTNIPRVAHFETTISKGVVLCIEHNGMHGKYIA